MTNKLKTFGTVIFVSLLYCGIFGILSSPFNETSVATSGKASDSVTLPIITYHSVLNEDEQTGKYIITPKTLDDDIKYLKNNGYEFISAKDLIAYTNGGFLPEKPILLTFDDGLYNSCSHVMPILEKDGARGIISVICSRTDEYSESKIADSIHGYLRWSEVYDMLLNSRTEVAIQSYNCNFDNFFDDTQKALDRFLTKTGFEPVIYTYSSNIAVANTTEVLKKLGFKISLTCEEGNNIVSKNPDSLFNLKRYERTSNITTEDFFSAILQ